MNELKPMAWPKPVPLLGWLWDATGNYADIRERARKYGKLDTEEIWLPDSGDSWGAFTRRSGIPDFGLDWRGIDQRNRERQRQAEQRARARYREEVREQQEQWEARQRQQQQAKQAQADREWQAAKPAQAEQQKPEDPEKLARAERMRNDIAEARQWWGSLNPAYATQPYREMRVLRTGVLDGVTLHADRVYWLPQGIVERLAQ